MGVCDHFISEPELPFVDMSVFDEVMLIGRYGAAGLPVWSRVASRHGSQSAQRLLVYAEAPNDHATVARVLGSLRFESTNAPALVGQKALTVLGQARAD